MTKIVTHLLEPAAATKSRTVGLFLWQLDDQLRKLTIDTRGATPEELEWQPAPGMNTIGMLLAHMALVEVGWIGAAARDLDFFKIDELPVSWADSGIPAAPGAAPPAALSGKDLSFYDDVLKRARAYTNQAVAALSDADLETPRTRVRRDGARMDYNVGWALYHALEHFAGHFGQILLLRHQYRLARARV
jgi:uncharacterized damage-inducible protein DinB